MGTMDVGGLVVDEDSSDLSVAFISGTPCERGAPFPAAETSGESWSS